MTWGLLSWGLLPQNRKISRWKTKDCCTSTNEEVVKVVTRASRCFGLIARGS